MCGWLAGWLASCLPGPLNVVGAVDVAELSQAEAVSSGGVHIAVHRHRGAGGRHLEGLPHLHVHLKVGDGAPVLRSWVVGAGGGDSANTRYVTSSQSQ